MNNELTVIHTDLTAIPLDQNPAAVYLASLSSKHSQSAMRNSLNLIADVLAVDQLDKANHDRYLLVNWSALRFQHTQAIRAALSERVKHTTANLALSALRGVLRAAYRLGKMTSDEYTNASDISGIKGQSAPSGRDLAMGEILALAQACKADKSPLGARDAAILGVLYTCGLRRAELVALALADFDSNTGKLSIQSGKGRKARTVYVTNGALAALTAWIEVRGQESGPLFLEIRRGGHIQHGKGLTAQAIYKMLKSRADQAGVKDFSPHDFRRTFVGDMLDRGADIATVAKLAGHASVTTTARYDRRDEETKKKAAGLLHFPF